MWLRSEEGRVVRSGPCPAYVMTSHQAELAAIFAGVYLAITSWPGRTRNVLVCSDCEGALYHARADSPLSRKTGTRRLQEKLRALLAEHSVGLSLRWVKGHRPGSEDTRAYLNNAVDRLARTARLTDAAKQTATRKPARAAKRARRRKRRAEREKAPSGQHPACAPAGPADPAPRRSSTTESPAVPQHR